MVPICERLKEASDDVAYSPLSQLQALASAIHSGLDQLLASRDAAAISTAEEVLSRCDLEIQSQGKPQAGPSMHGAGTSRHTDPFAQAGVCSNNEEADDLSTQDLPLLIVPFTRAELLSGAACPGGPTQRVRMVQAAISYYSRFLHRLEMYRLLGAVAARQYEAVAEAEGDSRDSGALVPSSSSPSPHARGNLNDRRQAKIDRFKAEREIKSKLEQIESKRRSDVG